MYEELKQAMFNDKETIEWLELHGVVFALSFRFFPAWCEKQGIFEYEAASYIRFGQEFGWLPLAGVLLDQIHADSEEPPIWTGFDEEIRNQLLDIVNKTPFASNPLVRPFITELETGCKSSAVNTGTEDEPNPYALKAELRKLVESWFVKELGLDHDLTGAERRRLRKVIDEAPKITVPIHAIGTIIKIYNARNKLIEEKGCEPSVAEIANTANVKADWVEEWIPWILDSRNEEIIKNQIRANEMSE